VPPVLINERPLISPALLIDAEVPFVLLNVAKAPVRLTLSTLKTSFAVPVFKNHPPYPAVASPTTPCAPAPVPLAYKQISLVTSILNLALNDFSPPISCEPVVIKPLLFSDALGILKVCVSTELTIAKSVPVLPTAKY